MSAPSSAASQSAQRAGYQLPRRQPPTIHPAARRLNAIFPGVTTWYGTHTGTWWAVLRGGDRLLEAATPEALEQLIAALLLGQRPPAPTARSAAASPPISPEMPPAPAPASRHRRFARKAPLLVVAAGGRFPVGSSTSGGL